MEKKNNTKPPVVKKIPEQLLSEGKIRATMKESGIRNPRNESIQYILYHTEKYLRDSNLEISSNARIKKSKKELQTFLKALEKTLEVYNEMYPPHIFLTVPTIYVDYVGFGWRRATDKAIEDIKRRINTIDDKERYTSGRKKRGARMLYVNKLIYLFEKETGKNFIVEYDNYRDVDRRKFDKSGMKFLTSIMNSVYPELTDDSLRKDIARAFDSFGEFYKLFRERRVKKSKIKKSKINN